MIDYPFFTAEELNCKCGECEEHQMDPDFMDKLVAMREDLDFPFPLNSAYRCEKHNRNVGGSEHSAHVKGRGVDIRCSHRQALQIVDQAVDFGFTGIGVNQHGDSRFIHLDDLEDQETPNPRPHIWSYP